MLYTEHNGPQLVRNPYLLFLANFIGQYFGRVEDLNGALIFQNVTLRG